MTFPSHCCSDFSCRGSKPERVTVPVSCKNLPGLVDCCATCLDVGVGDEKLLEGFKSDLVELNLDFLPGGEDEAGLGRTGKPFLAAHLILNVQGAESSFNTAPQGLHRLCSFAEQSIGRGLPTPSLCQSTTGPRPSPSACVKSKSKFVRARPTGLPGKRWGPSGRGTLH